MTKPRSTHQTSMALSTFIVLCGNLRAKSIKIWTNSCGNELLSGDNNIIRSDSVTSRKVLVPVRKKEDVDKTNSSINSGAAGEEEVHMTLLGSRKWKAPRKPTSFSNGEVAEYGSVKKRAFDSNKSKALDHFACFNDIIEDRVLNPEKHRARTILAMIPTRKGGSLLKQMVQFTMKTPEVNRIEHMLVEVEWYTYRGWHDKEPEKDLWI